MKKDIIERSDKRVEDVWYRFIFGKLETGFTSLEREQVERVRTILCAWFTHEFHFPDAEDLKELFYSLPKAELFGEESFHFFQQACIQYTKNLMYEKRNDYASSWRGQAANGNPNVARLLN